MAQNYLSRRSTVQQIESQLKDARPGDILLFYHATGINQIIPFLTRSPFFHVGLYAGDYEIIEARPQGVLRRDLRDVEDIHHFALIPAPADKGLHALKWAGSQIGAGYDRTGVTVLFLDRVLTHWHLHYTPNGKWTCGEFVATAFDQSGKCLFPDHDLNDTEPADFAPLIPPENYPPDIVQMKTPEKIRLGAAVCSLLAASYLMGKYILGINKSKI